MNDRIKELAEQAGWDSHHSKFDTRIEKFAELIIKECLDQCYNKGMNDALYEGQLKAASYIEHHFRVKE